MTTDEYINVDKLIDDIYEMERKGTLRLGSLIARIATVERFQIDFSPKEGFKILRVRPEYKIRR